MNQSASSSQEAAIRHRDGPALVLAGPGSGKTYVLVQRLWYLTEKCGIPPGDILMITFTNAAAAQMKERAMQLIPDKAPGITFGTFHSVFFLILKHTFNLTSENILSASLKHRILTDLIRHRDINVPDRETLISDLLSDFSARKNSSAQSNMTSLSDEEEEALFNAYNERLKELRLLDFDDMLLKCRELFLKHPEVLKIYRERFKYICVDEFQDVNSVQYETVCLLAGSRNNLFAVGDDDQSIYAFRGSTPGIMQKFLAGHEGVKKYDLFTNYRSLKAIVDAAGRLISHNSDRLEKNIEPFDMTGGSVVIKEFETKSLELQYMADYIKERLEYDDPEDFAILLRTNSQSGFYSEGLRLRGIKCRVKGKSAGIYNDGVGKDIMDYLKLAAGDRSRKVFVNVMNKPDRGILRCGLEDDRMDLDRLITYFCDEPEVRENIEKLEFDLSRISKMKPRVAVHYILNIVGYKKYIEKYSGKDTVIHDAMMAAADEMLERAGSFASINEWIEYAGEDKECPDEEGVLILTMHSAKGLEFKHVLLPDINEGIIPGKKAFTEAEIEEERRLFYVAMTRAKSELLISYINKNNGRKIYPSRFIGEVNQGTVP